MKERIKRLLTTAIGHVYRGAGNRIICFHEIQHHLVFYEKMIWLKRHYQVVSLEQLIADPGGSGKIALTFDDGFKCWYTTAVPILRKLELPAVFFVNSGLVGLTGERMMSFFQRQCQRQDPGLLAISRRELREISVDPLFEIGGHTVNHFDFSRENVSEEVLKFEIEADKRSLEEMVGTPLRWFAYPFGAERHAPENVRQISAAAGYQAAFTIMPGFVDYDTSKRYQIRRDALNYRDPLSYWRARLAGGYDHLLAVTTLLRQQGISFNL